MRGRFGFAMNIEFLFYIIFFLNKKKKKIWYSYRLRLQKNKSDYDDVMTVFILLLLLVLFIYEVASDIQHLHVWPAGIYIRNSDACGPRKQGQSVRGHYVT